MRDVVYVGYKQVYDLVFRARNAKLNSVAYVLDYNEWVKAGVAYNTRGFEISTRKISYFAELYKTIQAYRDGDFGVLERQHSMLEESLIRYYEDIFDVYQDHLRSKQEDVRRKNKKIAPDFGELLVLPCFDEVPELHNEFETVQEEWDMYKCLDEVHFLEKANSAYLKQGTGLYTCMSMMYDYGLGQRGRGKLLEVKLWDSAV